VRVVIDPHRTPRTPVQGEQDDRVADHVPALGQEPDDKLGIPCELKPVAGRRQRTGEPSLGARRRPDRSLPAAG
jgi:hypothetical protein